MLQHVYHSLAKAWGGESKLPPEVLAIEGMSGSHLRHLLNNLCEYPGARYLEVGLWQGSTFCSALYGNQIVATGIDNWSGFGGPYVQFFENHATFCGAATTTIHEQSCWEIEPATLQGPFNIFLYDGGHSQDEQHRAVLHFWDALADTFVLLVDDWNRPEVRDGTHSAITIGRFDVLLNTSVRTTYDDSECRRGRHEKTLWWNGVGLFVCQKRR